MRRVTLLAVLALLSLPAGVQAQTETIEYYATDAIGSIRVVFGANGAVLGRQDYGPFGSELLPAPTLPPERFGGQEKDAETDQGYFHARQYQSRTGRFTRVDPIYAGLFEPQRWNRYSYALNNPLAYVDPQGLSATLWQCVEYPGVCLEDVVDITRAGPGGGGGGGFGNDSGRGGGGNGNQKPPPPVVVDPPTVPPDPPPAPGPEPEPEGCPAVPPGPTTASLQANMQEASIAQYALPPVPRADWYYERVRNARGRQQDVTSNRSWDYKQLGYESFGNFNYGAAGTRAGFSPLQLVTSSVFAHVSSHRWAAALPGNIMNELRDQITIVRGIS